MKIKRDFITNSSSTAFVVYGFLMDIRNEVFDCLEDGDIYEEKVATKKLGLSENVDIYTVPDSIEVAIGKQICFAYDDCGTEVHQVDLKKLFEEAEKAAKEVQKRFSLETQPMLISGVTRT